MNSIQIEIFWMLREHKKLSIQILIIFYNETKLNFNLLISLSFCLWAPLNQQLKMLRWKKGEKKAQKHISEQNVCCILNGRIMW